MPQKVTLADGTEMEVLTQDEINKLQSQLDEANNKIAELESDSKNRDWRGLRQAKEDAHNKLERINNILSANNLKIDDNGNIVKSDGNILDLKQPTVTYDKNEIENIATNAAIKTSINQLKNRILSNITDDSIRGAISKVYDKLTANEEVTHDNVIDYIRQAIRVVNPEQSININMRPAGFGIGMPPIIDNKNNNRFSDTETGKQLAKELGINIELPQDNK